MLGTCSEREKRSSPRGTRYSSLQKAAKLHREMSVGNVQALLGRRHILRLPAFIRENSERGFECGDLMP